MADRTIRTPDGQLHQFPADATDAEIASALKTPKTPSQGADKAPAKRGWIDTAIDALPAIEGTVGGIVGGVAGAGAGGLGGVTLGAASGEAHRQLIQRARGKTTPSSSREAALGIGKEAVVSGAVPEVVGMGLGAAAKPVAGRLMESAVGRVSKTMLKDFKTSTRELAQTLLDRGVNVTQGGLKKLDRLVDAGNAEIDAVIGSLKGVVSPSKVAQRTDDVAARLTKQVNPRSDLAVVDASTEEFLQHPTLTARSTSTGPGAYLKPVEAHEMKKGTYQQIRRKTQYGELGGAQIETQKALARGLREEIEGLATAQGKKAIAGLNQAEKKLLAAHEVVAQRLAESGRASTEGLAWVAKHPLMFLLSVARMEGAPIRSVLARSMSGGQKAFRYVSPLLVRAATVALSGGDETGAGSPAEAK